MEPPSAHQIDTLFLPIATSIKLLQHGLLILHFRAVQQCFWICKVIAVLGCYKAMTI